MKVYCKEKCGFEDEYEPTELGMTYFEAVGTCPNCESPTVDADGNETAMRVEFEIIERK